MSRILVAYFSASGVTAGVAKTLAQATGADLYEIKPKIPYTDDDLNFHNRKSRSSIEMNDLSSRPDIADKNARIAEYDRILIGFPIWWYYAPTLINTFLESYDFSGKIIGVFATSGTSGLGKTIENLKMSVSETAIWKTGKMANGANSAESLAAWAKSSN